MRKGVLAVGFVILSGICFVSLGCDQIQSMFSPNLKSKTSSTGKASVVESTPAVTGTVLAKVNSIVITVEDFDEKIKNLQAMSPDAKLGTVDAKKEFLNNLIAQELVAQEARARGIDKKKEVRDAIEDFKKNVVARQLIMDETRGIVVQESDITDFYNAYKKQYFTTPSEIKMREIVVATEPIAKEVLISLLQGSDFAAVAKEKSIAPSASSGGDAGVLKQESKFDKYREVAVTLEVGQVSPIFKGPDGFYIIKTDSKTGGTTYVLTDKVPGSDMTVRDYISNLLLQQKQDARIKEITDKLRAEAKIDIKEDLLR